MFNEYQKSELAKPLNRAHVATRAQGGGQVSYIEAWHAINEANRIFGFDGWTRETIDLRQLGEPYEVNGKQRVNYSARVRVCVRVDGGPPIVREGCGFGQGIDRDVGQAHESALKEAETDAMKRALMTFGNPFGLALYDKTQANVEVPAPPTISDDQRIQLMNLMEANNYPVATFLKVSKITELRQLPAEKFEGARNWLHEQITKKEAA